MRLVFYIYLKVKFHESNYSRFCNFLPNLRNEKMIDVSVCEILFLQIYSIFIIHKMKFWLYLNNCIYLICLINVKCQFLVTCYSQSKFSSLFFELNSFKHRISASLLFLPILIYLHLSGLLVVIRDEWSNLGSQ